MSGKVTTDNGMPIKQCSFTGNHIAHPHGESVDALDEVVVTEYHCHGVGSVKTCSACGAMNLSEATACVECTLPV